MSDAIRFRRFRVAALLSLFLPGAAAAAELIRSERHSIEVTPLVTGLASPWSFAFLPDGDILITEKPGTLRIVRQGKLLQAPVAGLPAVAARGQGGLLDVVPHPDFVRNRWVYWSYSAGEEGSTNIGTEVARGKLVCRAADCSLTDVEVLFRQFPKVGTAFHFGSRLVFSRDGHLFITLGDRGQQDEAQNLGNHLGKILRLTDSGAVPADNPFVKRAGARPEIYSFGNRNVQGAALHPATGQLWAHEHGPQGGDELNIITAGTNYGWPVITFGRTYGKGEQIGEGTERDDVAKAQKTWVPSVAPSGLTFYTGDRFANWRNNAFLGTLREQRLIRLTLDGDRVTGEERIEGLGRIRSVRAGTDGYLYVLSESKNTLFRLAPATP